MMSGIRLNTAGVVALAGALLLSAAGHAEPPPLPDGLGAPAQASDGDDDQEASEPELPSGLGGTPPAGEAQDTYRSDRLLPDYVSGFIEGRAGWRTQDDPFQKAASIGEARLQLRTELSHSTVSLRVVGDLLYDAIDEERSIDLETGQGWFDLREASITLRPLSFMDVKAGRQILTWGTGDLIFINDLFPKDFQSFFIGRDDEYLKAPSDALRVSVFSDLANLDLVYTPRFDADRSLDGSRLTFFNPTQARLTGRDAVLRPDRPDGWFEDDELSARLYRNIGSFETAVYFYNGFWKSPGGITLSGDAIHPDLRVYGASLRGPLLGGIVSSEIGHYDSRDDAPGSDPLIQNSETRFLVGYETEALPQLTVGAQYFAQRLSDYDALADNLLPGQREPMRIRHTLTLRLTKLAFNQTLTLSAFNFWSPNDDDGHLRLRAGYKLDDNWLVEGGANVFYGPDEQTFFGQLKTNTNMFVGIRRSF